MPTDRQMPRLSNRIRAALLIIVNLYFAFLIVYLAARLLWDDVTSGPLALLNTFAFWLHVPLLIVVPVALLLRKIYTVLPALALAVSTALWLVVPMFPQPSEARDTGQELKVITFNLYTGNRQIDSVVDWLLEQEPDVIMFQEVSYANAVRTPLDRLMTALPHVLYFEKSLLFSRFPIVEQDTASLSKGEKGRELIHAVLELESGNIAVYGVRLSTPNLSAGGYNEDKRNDQIAYLFDVLDDETLPFIIGGDFNLSEYSTVYHDLSREIQDAFRTAGTGPGFTWGPSQLPFLVMRLDYVFADSAFEITDARVGPDLHSDHRPVVVTLHYE